MSPDAAARTTSDDLPGARRVPVGWFWGLVAAGTALDQATKHAAFAAVGVIGYHDVPNNGLAAISGFFYITPRYNTGMAWSVANAMPWYVLALVNVVVTALVVWYRQKAEVRAGRRVFDGAMGLIVAGAAGNLMDRCFTAAHAVMDFLDFRLGSWPYPTFNLADVYVVAGVALYVYWGWWLDRQPDGRKAA